MTNTATSEYRQNRLAYAAHRILSNKMRQEMDRFYTLALQKDSSAKTVPTVPKNIRSFLEVFTQKLACARFSPLPGAMRE